MFVFWLALTATIIVFTCCMVFGSYRLTYTVLISITACVPMTFVWLQAKHGMRGGEVSTMVITAVMAAVIMMLFVSSLMNLFRRRGVSLALSVTGLLVSGILMSICALLFKMAGGGMIG